MSFCLPLQVMEFYCESCETAMCLECTEGEHREHVTVPLRDVLEQHKAALKNQLDAIRNRFMQPKTILTLTVKLSQYLKLIFIPFFRLYTESVIFLPTF